MRMLQKQVLSFICNWLKVHSSNMYSKQILLRHYVSCIVFLCYCTTSMPIYTFNNGILQEYDACSFTPCTNNATCQSVPPARDFSCECVLGFDGPRCENNIDDCVGHDCQDFQQCFDGINEFNCACPVGECIGPYY